MTLKITLQAAFKKNPKLLFFPALLIGVSILLISTALKPKLAVSVSNAQQRVVDILPLEKIEVAPRAIGFGQVKPKQQWSAIAEVSGEIIYKSPLLSKGKFISAGTEILRIDPLKYQLALAQAEADLKSQQLALEKLLQEEINLAENLKIEQSRLLLPAQENKRLTKLQKQGLFSQSDLDNQRLELLTLKKSVQEIQQELTLFANQKLVAQAQIKLSTASLGEANRALTKTVITVPRNIKLAEVGVELNQVVNLNEMMVIGHALEVMEVEAQVSIDDMHRLITSLQTCLDCKALTPDFLKQIGASILLNSGQMHQAWQATVTRISETIAQNQATVGVILEIAQESEPLKSGRAPLLNGMFIQATLTGKKSPQFSVPEKALHTNHIYLLDDDNKLKIVPVNVLYRRATHVVISANINEGDKLVLNDLLPAVAGMSLVARAEVNSNNAISTDIESK